ncbi:MAG: sugar ABC transporter substrate-binding protein [Lachnospiraceae bacterium]|nr:sugar ABC transporter substrate-binding protein [Lachnospiraceae bacterium]
MKKFVMFLLALAMVLALVACGDDEKPANDNQSNNSSSSNSSSNTTKEETKEVVNGKFTTKRTITVEIYDRGNDGGSDPENNMYTDYIKKGMLEKHNVEVVFKKVPRWTEVDDINNLLAANQAPDICVTYSYPTILTYANMGGVLDLSKLVEDNKADLPNLWNWLEDTNILWDKDPDTGVLWAIEGKRNETERIVTFMRQDWLDKLGLKTPTTKAEFEKCLVAFRDNAKTLLGADADKMIPFSVSYDIGWRASNLIESFVDPNVTEKEFYTLGFDDRMLTQKSTKDAIKLLNKWYNDGLLWKDFALYGSGDTTEDSYLKAGYVGAFTHNWDYPFRNGADSINANLAREVGPEAKFVAVDCFENAAGEYKKWLYSSAGDRKIFFPATNDEPLASMYYLDFISTPEVIAYLQMGDKGVTHEVLESGAIQIIGATGAAIQNSGKNIDYTITCNGTYYGDQALAAKSKAYGYAEIDPALVEQASNVARNDAVSNRNVNVGEIAAEAGVGDTLSAKRDQAYDNAVVCKVADFDKVWNEYLNDYLASGGQDIIDERTQKWEKYFGSATSQK